MIDYTPFYDSLADTQLASWLATLPTQIAAALADEQHGNLLHWQNAIAQLPTLTPTQIELQSAVSVIGEIDEATRAHLVALLQQLHPWRKGPYTLYGIDIDTEWHSDWKWDRLAGAIAPLAGRRVLDVGCGNGYHAWRMAGAGASQVIGLDPFLLYVAQYGAIRHFIPAPPVTVLPLGIEQLPADLHAFDTIFSMGVFYHRRSPFDHLLQLREALRSGGQLVLETLVIDEQEGQLLVPEGRYAQMRNVWFIPSCQLLASWLKKMQFRHIELIDVTVTSAEEQRQTAWMRFHSLSDFLDPHDSTRTIEGYPAPRRAIFTATAPL